MDRRGAAALCHRRPYFGRIEFAGLHHFQQCHQAEPGNRAQYPHDGLAVATVAFSAEIMAGLVSVAQVKIIKEAGNFPTKIFFSQTGCLSIQGNG